MKNLLFILLSIFCLNSFGQTHSITDTTVTRYLRAKSGSKLYLMHPLVFSDASEQQSGVTNTLFSNWNSAYNLSHSHANLSLLSAIKPQDTARWASGGVTPTDNILHWDATNNWYAPYSSKQSFLSLYKTLGILDYPDLTDTMKLNGKIWATSLITSQTTGTGIIGSSTTNIGVYGISNSSYGVYGSSNTFTGVSGYSDSYVGTNGNSNSGIGIRGQSATGYAGYFVQSGTSAPTFPTAYITRITSGSSNVTESLLKIVDNPTTTGLISGPLISGLIGSTERLRLDPRVKGHADSTAFVFDTHRPLFATDTLFTIKDYGNNKFQVLYDGSIISKGSIIKLGPDTAATQAYVRAHGSSGGGTWGTITGTLSNQTDLQSALNAKQAKINITLSDATSSSQTITLPDATLHNNDIYFVKKIDNSANTVTVQATSSQTIDGNTSLVLSYQYSSLTIISNGTNWFIISIL